MKNHITPFQLFFLTFSYLLSGFFLFSVRSWLALIAQFAAFSVFAVLAAPAFVCKREGLCDTVDAFAHGAFGKILTALLLIPAMFQTVRTLTGFSVSAGTVTNFLPSWLILLVLLATAIYAVWRGMTAVGRFAELVPFLLVPLLCMCVFGKFSPAQATSDFDAWGALSCVSAAPVFFLAAKCVVPGDVGVSTAMNATAPAPKDRAAFLLRVMIGGAAAAVGFYVFFLLFDTGAHNVLLRLAAWMLHLIRLSVLIALVADVLSYVPAGARERAHMPLWRSVFAAVIAISCAAVLAVNEMGITARDMLMGIAIGLDFIVPVVIHAVPMLARYGKKEKHRREI